MMRSVALLVVTSALVLAIPAAAQDGPMPTELWAEYPLVQKVERTSQPGLAPLLRPSDTERPPVSEDSRPWAFWALAAAVGLVAVLVATRVLRPAYVSTLAEPLPIREPRGHDRLASRPRTFAQYAPTRAPEAAGLVDEPPRSIVLRSGLLRARYVVVADEWAGGLETVGGSKSFWAVGGAERRARLAEDAWDELVNDLRVQGWEPNSLRRSEYYVLLQRIEPGPTSTIRA